MDGKLESLDIKINGEINLFKLQAAPKDLSIKYSAQENLLQITGELAITLAPKLTLTAGLPGDGLLLDTDTGKVQIRGISLKADGDISFGKMTIKGLHVDYEESANGDVTIGAGAEIALPSGLAVGGSFKIINGKLDAIAISFEKNPGILVANGLINIYRLEVAVEGLSDLENFKFSGAIKATVGPLVKFGGESYALADVTGRVTITPRDLTLEGDVVLVGGKFGNGVFKGVLTWNETPRVTFSADVRLYPGDIVRGKINAYADIRGNVDFNAQMGVFVPKGVPLVGEASLGQLNVELRIRPAEEPSASYAKFGFSDFAITSFRVPTFHGSVRIGFDKLVDYNFGARFYIPLPWPLPDIDYSLDFGGRFELRDSDNPTIQILAASSLSGTPDGEILYAAATAFPEDTIIDIYADRDQFGNDGLLIASSIPFREGTQSFRWENMASFANPGEPIFVYAVVNDQKNAKGYSEYSPQFNTAPGFEPSIQSPSLIEFQSGQPVMFAQELGRVIAISDPRRSSDPDAELEAVLRVANGTLDLSHVPERVRYFGMGSSEITLRGSSAAITAALDGLTYIQNSESNRNDQLQIQLRSLPLASLAPDVEQTIELKSKGIWVESFDDLQVATVSTGIDNYPLSWISVSSIRNSQMLGATISIENYERGKDILSLDASIEQSTGIESHFDQDLGTLVLTGFDWVEDYEYALQQVLLTTTSVTTGKKLQLMIADEDGESGILSLPLQVVAGHTAPKLNLSRLGLNFIIDSPPVRLDAESSLEVSGDSTIQSFSIHFVRDSFAAGEDRLIFPATEFITGEFNPTDGSLVLTDWERFKNGPTRYRVFDTKRRPAEKGTASWNLRWSMMAKATMYGNLHLSSVIV